MVNQKDYFGIEEALTPLDGRNRFKLTSLIKYYSDFNLNKYRVLVEINYLIKLSLYKVVRQFTKDELILINRLIDTFNINDYHTIRQLERKTNHETMAVVEFLREKLLKSSLKNVAEMIHFGLTSDDINNLAYALMIKDCLKKVIYPEVDLILVHLKAFSKEYKSLPMLGRTHGQPAVPTTLGKEFLIYFKRLNEEMKKLGNWKMKGKLTGNVGNLNAHKFLFPKINWLKFSQEFVENLGLIADLVTTQIEPYDSYIELFYYLTHINNILIGLSQDLWSYISLGYFKQKIIKTEVGSSALPHKVNPIYFEGAEGGFGIANGLFEFYIRKLAITRFQRDLSDSTVRRSFGIAFGYSLLSYQSINEGLLRIVPDEEKIKEDLNNHFEVLSEAVQNFFRVKGEKNAYEKAKEFFRGKKITRNDLLHYINIMKFLSKKEKKMLLDLTLESYTGYAEELVDKFL